MIVLRHAETVFNVVFGATRQDPGVRDPGLTDAGREQAHSMMETLQNEAVSRVVCSPYRRALQTADAIAGGLGIPLTVEPLIRERAAFICDIGTPRSQLARDWSGYEFHHLDEVWWSEIEEPETSLHARCREFCGAMAKAPDQENIAVITHWGVIRALTGLKVKNCETVRIDPARILADAHLTGRLYVEE